MSKTVHELLNELNIVDLEILNRELSYAKHGQVEKDSVLSDLDYKYLVGLFRTSQMIDLIYAYKELENRKKELSQSFLNNFLKEIKPIDQMGEIERQFYFKWIIGYGQKYVSFQTLFHNASSWDFSEQKFVWLYNWYKSWRLNSKEEIEQKEKEAISFYFDHQPPIKTRRCPDEETAIMSALKNGYGDAYGF